MPVARSDGNRISEPPPAMLFTTPQARPAATTIAASNGLIRRRGRRQPVELDAEEPDVAEVVGSALGHDQAAAGPPHREALGLEAAQGVTNRRAADLEAVSELDLVEAAAGRRLAVHHGPAQLLVDG